MAQTTPPETAPTRVSRARGPVTATAVGKKRNSRFFLLDLYGTAVGKKYVMAITGVIGIGYVVAHMVGNLKMYLGVESDGIYAIDHYGEFLRELLVPIVPRTVTLWILRSVLIAALLLHLHAAYTLTVVNHRARPVKYQTARDYQVASFASRTMRWTGAIVLLFIIWHLLDLTGGQVNPDFVRGETYRNIDASLSRVPVAIFYILANIALGTHLYHGVWSLFQSIGWNSPRFNEWRRWLAIGVATAVVVGNVSFPVAVLAGVVKV